ncbi:restriction endonuclease subunit S [Photobacterium sp. OFAV2-7]|uniref:restriction endonuclease subunit S n=1 Tax=Photobacterium sp. OFAV2-7 TaxID=2917748 RepID=UPI001EF60C40|nr:restriction endonuclease subunit S [Photobacterium sp. OFAV2-7]MCG7584796.1 restriction endonuclease subunit S [Photobacterium sp. OFAV2-7]
MVKIVRVPSSDFSPERLDTGFYSKEYYDAKKKLEKLGLPIEKVGSICEPWQFGAYALCSEIEWSKDKKDVCFIKAEGIESPLLNESRFSYVTKKTHQLLYKSSLKSGDIIVSTSGTVGRLAVIPENIQEANSNQDTIKFSLEGTDYDSYFVAGWLTSKYAQAYMQREAGGAVQQHIYLYNFKRLPLIKPASVTQRYIGDKIRQAEQLKAWAKYLQCEISDVFNFLVDNPPKSKVSYWTSSEDLDPYRINPNHYDPKVLGLLKRAKAAGVLLEPLSKLVGERKVAGGATPKGADYFDEGVLFGRVQNVKPLSLDLSDAVYINEETDNQLTRSKCIVDDIILSITGYPGTASLVTSRDLPININQHSVRFNIKEEVGTAYVCAALNSTFLKLQVDRLSIGGTRDALDYPSVESLLIPRLDKDFEDKVDRYARDYIEAVKLSQELITCAKLLVEDLIEGQITEQQLIDAQQALDNGDDSLDRLLLSRMTAEGIDGEGAPLFEELDQLYDLLAQARQAADNR